MNKSSTLERSSTSPSVKDRVRGKLSQVAQNMINMWEGRSMRPEHRDRRVMAGVALSSVLIAGGIVGGTHEYTVDERTVSVDAKAGTVAEQVCDAVGKLVGEENLERDACKNDLEGITLPDGTKISVSRTVQPVSPGGLMVPNIRTDLDPLQKKNQ